MRLSSELVEISLRTFSKISKNFTIILGSVSLMSVPAIASDEESFAVAASAIPSIDLPSANDQTELPAADRKFRAIYSSWGNKQLVPAQISLSIPSIDPVTKIDISSYYGYRTDPFQGRRKNHKGLDIRGPVGTPIYATADGFVKTSKWFSGYGNFIELDHGNKISTRYGHMSKLIVKSNQRVSKGDIIGLMGSTGRSTGSHLHYEVRIEGEPVNPQAFMTHQSDAVRIAEKASAAKAQGGPDE